MIKHKLTRDTVCESRIMLAGSVSSFDDIQNRLTAVENEAAQIIDSNADSSTPEDLERAVEDRLLPPVPLSTIQATGADGIIY